VKTPTDVRRVAAATVLTYTARIRRQHHRRHGRLNLPRPMDCRIDGNRMHVLTPGTHEVVFT
jgi:hypothetical protein